MYLLARFQCVFVLKGPFPTRDREEKDSVDISLGVFWLGMGNQLASAGSLRPKGRNFTAWLGRMFLVFCFCFLFFVLFFVVWKCSLDVDQKENWAMV